MIRKNANKQSRHGFTLVELLIVMSIMATLMGLSVMVMSGVTDSATEQATITTILKLDGLVQQRSESFEHTFAREGSFRQRYIDATNIFLHQRGIIIPPEYVPILAKKVAFRHQFPQRHEDLLKLDFDADGTTPLFAYNDDTIINPGNPGRDALDGNANWIHDEVEKTATDISNLPTADSPVRDSTVSSELLYYTLIHADNFGVGTSVADQFSTSEIADTDQDGLPEFVDAYGEPLRFYRWPTRLIDRNAPDPFQPNLTNKDSNGNPIVDLTDVLENVKKPDGTMTTIGVRVISDVPESGVTLSARDIAGVLLKGLPPAPVELQTGILLRDQLFIDPDDPLGILYSAMEGSGALASEYNETWYHTPETFHTPLIVSAGLDLALGLYEPSDTTNLGNLANYDKAKVDELLDNITNRNRRNGGRR